MSKDEPIINQDQMAALLGRPLVPQEADNYDLYLEIAALRIEDLLCLKLSDLQQIPADLQLLIARCFGVIVQEQSDTANHGISNKKVEDFSISYFEEASAPMVEFVKINAKTIDKYGQCQAAIRSGKVDCGNCLRCI